MITTAIAILTSLLPLAQGQQQGQQQGQLLEQPQDQPPTDKEIREAWSYLLPKEKEEVTQWFTAETSYFASAQNRLIDYILATDPRDRGTYPATTEAPYYDPETHCPKQPIKRKPLAADSNKAKSAYEDLVGRLPQDPLAKAWAYDWTTGDIVKLAEETDPAIIFENALLGLPPRTDLAEALLLRLLDDGSQRETLSAFGHAYTDRSGYVYPGITLYDAWCSGRTFEMPDVDNLGLYHDLFDDWKTYTAPVPDSRHKKLYGKIGDVFLDAKHHRQLLEAAAVNYIRGKAIPTNVYTPNSLALNTLWEEAGGDPAEFADQLPKPKDWEKYMKGLTKKIKKKKFRDVGQGRIDWFEGERWQVKAKMIWVLQEFGAFDRDALPEPPKDK